MKYYEISEEQLENLENAIVGIITIAKIPFVSRSSYDKLLYNTQCELFKTIIDTIKKQVLKI